MIQKKVCMVGTSGVGKTSLVAKFVHSMFSDKYLTTVGVKIDEKTRRRGFLRTGAEMRRQRALACSTLAGREDNDVHVRPLWLVIYTTAESAHLESNAYAPLVRGVETADAISTTRHLTNVEKR